MSARSHSPDDTSGIEARISDHARSFEALMALTPARDYYGSQIADGKDPSEQWNRRKQSKEEKKAAKKAKLDPVNQKSALDVMKERERKRKRELGMDDESIAAQPESKSAKVALDADATANRCKTVAEKRKQKRIEKKEKGAKKREKQAKREAQKVSAEDEPESPEVETGPELEGINVSGLVVGEDSTAPPSPSLSPAFDVATNASSASSNTTVAPADAEPQVVKPTVQHEGVLSPKLQLPDMDPDELKERLRIKIEELRAKRKADGPDGKPARSRQELLEQRRKKEQQRKAAKKEQIHLAKEKEQQLKEQQLRNSPSSIDVFKSKPKANNFAFSRLAFADGTMADANLTTLQEQKKKKGPQDPRTALEAAQKKTQRLAGYDEAKRADIAEKDSWLNAKKRAHGERVRDDTSLLKKALKRKEKQKMKSERQWQEREQAVIKSKEAKQKKREANLQQRKDGKKKGKKGGRPGFEGRFKA
ncbi:SURF6-domain-containing protein [Piedraia hortae CBS 480.64]|uniref:SURF6-domain-containing protein n=1 Tax=Piedraia hortae CBS 480.64 TaxID=1314780 RepID=A0A6A7C3X5_9PEZI|nr:SURF6-domain-containing protein [Piedraia hortae CBS 480.64]